MKFSPSCHKITLSIQVSQISMSLIVAIYNDMKFRILKRTRIVYKITLQSFSVTLTANCKLKLIAVVCRPLALFHKRQAIYQSIGQVGSLIVLLWPVIRPITLVLNNNCLAIFLS